MKGSARDEWLKADIFPSGGTRTADDGTYVNVYVDVQDELLDSSRHHLSDLSRSPVPFRRHRKGLESPSPDNIVLFEGSFVSLHGSGLSVDESPW